MSTKTKSSTLVVKRIDAVCGGWLTLKEREKKVKGEVIFRGSFTINDSRDKSLTWKSRRIREASDG